MSGSRGVRAVRSSETQSLKSGAELLGKYSDGIYYDCVVEEVTENGYQVLFTEYDEREELPIESLRYYADDDEEVASLTPELLAAIADADAFKRICKLKAFIAFNSAEQALENINAIAEHSVPDRLKTFLETNLPPVSSKKKKKGPAFCLGVVEPDLGKAIAEATGAHCRSDDVVRELLRGATQHLTKFVPELQNNLLEQAQVGLGHAFSRCKVKAPS